MASRYHTHLLLPAFGGQENSQSSFFGGDLQPLGSLPMSSFGATLLSACHVAFHEEFGSLDAQTLTIADIRLSNFISRESILKPCDEQQLQNPALSWPLLLLNQLLRYLALIEEMATSEGPVSLTDILNSNVKHGVGIMGLSSGIITACVISTSSSILSFINHAVEAYRLALWIGIKSQIHRAGLLTQLGNLTRPWAMVLLGMSQNDLERAVEHFNEVFAPICSINDQITTIRKAAEGDGVHVTAVMGDGRATVSGYPRDLIPFAKTLPDSVARQETTINAIYHCSAFLKGVRDDVLSCVASRKIRFPEHSDIVVPIRSTITGGLISNTTASGTLVELVTDMLLLHPVNWDLVIQQTAASLPHGVGVCVLDLGLGPSLLRTFETSARQLGVQRLEVLNDNAQLTTKNFKAKQDPIAIVGMAVNMPGAPNATELWELLINGGNTIQTIPGNRFHFEDYTGGNISGRSMRAQTGNFIRDVDQFDNKFFNISPREARSMDPQQRVLLQVGYEALEDAGYVPHATPTFDPATFGCFVGAATHDYINNLKNDIDVYYSTGTLKAFLSGRLSYCLGLSGPSIVVDTACSSSLVAIHQACRALMNRDCHAALAGGVNIISSPDMFIGLDRGHFLNSSGQCKPFDITADGYSRGEGCGIFVLKRLSDAISENDRILGIIKGVEVNQSGKASSITNPHAATQEGLLTQLLRYSGVESKSINVVEAHGTGTQAGDTAEMESLRRVLAVDRAPDNPLYITSIKANIGHLEPASGCASLAKILLMLKHQIVPWQISLTALNPRITRLDADNCTISTDNVVWMPPKSKTPRLAIINNFGAAGSNAALLIEEYIPQESILSKPNNETMYVYGLSAKTRVSLEVLRSKYLAWLQRPSTSAIAPLDLAYSSTARRQIFPYRLSVSAGSIQQLVKKFETSTVVHVKECSTGPGVVFVFSGQGQGHCHRGIAQSLYATSAVFKTHIDECDSILTSCGFAGILSVITGHAGDRQVLPPVQQEEEQQSATFSLQYALSKLWVSWGIRPIAVVGHSMGEYAALVTAGVLPLKDALFVIATRARIIEEQCAPMATGMLAVHLNAVQLQAILDSGLLFPNTTIACYNSPTDCVVSGPLNELKDLKTYLDKEGLGKATQLHIPYGYHSPLMSHLTDDLMVLAGKVHFFPTRIPLISTVLGCVIMPGDQYFPSHDYIARQCAGSVRLTEAIESFLPNLSSGEAAWLEISAHPSILPMLRSFPGLSDSLLLASLRSSEHAWTSLSRTLSSFYLGNYTVNWRHVFSAIGPTQLVGLPSYPFSTTKFWVPYVEETYKHPRMDHGTRFSFIKRWLQFPGSGDDKVAIVETPISQLKHYIKGHRVGGLPLCPASVYLELITGSITLAAEHTHKCMDEFEIVLSQIVFPKPLTWNSGDEDSDSVITISIDTTERSFTLKSRTTLHEGEAIHANGQYELRPRNVIEEDFTQILPSIVSSVDTIVNPKGPQITETFSARTIYQVIFPRVVEYSTDFRTLQYLSMLSDGMEATGSMLLPSEHKNGFYFGQPFFLDTLVHIAGFLSNLRGGQNDVYICNAIESVQLLPQAIKNSTSCTVYCKISQAENENILLCESFAFSETHPRKLVGHFKNIRFQRVRLSGLKAELAGLAGVTSSPFIERNRRDKFGHPPSPPSNVMATVVRIVAETCGASIEDVSNQQNLDRLGIDSLMRIELTHNLSKCFPGFGSRAEEMRTCGTVLDIVDTILNVIDRAPSCDDLTLNSPSLSDLSTSKTLVQSPNGSLSMRRIVARILDIDEDAIKDETLLPSLGLDSLASIEAAHILCTEFQLEVPGSLLNSACTILELEDCISKLEPLPFPSLLGGHTSLNRAYQHRFSALSQSGHKALSILQTTDSRRFPLVLFHDGSGLTVSYERLANLNRKVWTIRNPRFATCEPWSSMEEMARSYGNHILNEIVGPVILGGWSFGGVVAYEVARQLRNKSVAVKGLVLIDSPSPSLHVPLSSDIIDQVLDSSRHMEPESKKHCKSEFTTNIRLLCNYRPEEPDYTCPTIIYLMSNAPFYPIGNLQAPAWLSNRTDKAAIIAGWVTLARAPVKVLDIPGHHFQAFDPQNVKMVSDQIFHACGLLDDH